MQSPPSPPGQFLLGHMNRMKDDALSFMAELATHYEDIVHVRLAHINIFFMQDPELIREVLVKRADEFQKGDIGQHIFRKGLGEGLLVSEGEFHRRQRKLMQPVFHHKRIQSYGDIMADYTHRVVDGWQNGDVRDMNAEMMRLTMFIVSKALFDADMETMEAEAETAAAAIAGNQHWMEKEFWLGFKMPSWVPTAGNHAIKTNNRQLRNILQPIIEARHTPDGIDNRGDLLSMLMLAVDENGQHMDDKQLMDEVVSLFSAGHETTSNALSWTIYLLSQHSEIEQKLQTEIDSVLQGRMPTLADLPQLTYANMVLKESLRLYPTVWTLIFRQARQGTTIGGYSIPKNSLIGVSPYAIHRRSVYFSNPEIFDPERFHPDQEGSLPRYAYLPFGAGPHVCIGAQFAMMEAQLILAAMYQKYRFELHPEAVVEPEPLVTMGPKYGLKMILHQRQAVHDKPTLQTEQATNS